MAQIHNLETKTRYGSRYVAGFIILISSILLAGWFGFFTFLPIKSSMAVVTSLEDRFLPRAEGMVLNFVSLSEPSTIITSDNQILDELHDRFIFEMEIVDIATEEDLVQKYGLSIPVLLNIENNEVLYWPFDRDGVVNLLDD